MKRSLRNLSFAVGLLLTTSTPAPCDSDAAATPVTSPTAAPVAAPTVTSGKTSRPFRLANAPKALAGFCTGFVVGTPICFVRYLHRETMDMTHGAVGSFWKNDNNPYLMVPMGIFWLPGAVLIATVESPVYAFKNAYMADKPFSKEQFSLGELVDPSNL